MSKSVSIRRRDSARLVRRKKLARLRRLHSASLKKKLKAQMTVARATRTRMPWVKTTLTTKRPCWTRLRIQLRADKSLERTRIRMIAPRMMKINHKLKKPKLINLKRILEKTPESMQIPKKFIKIAEVVKSEKEVTERKVEVAVVAVDVEIRTRI